MRGDPEASLRACLQAAPDSLPAHALSALLVLLAADTRPSAPVRPDWCCGGIAIGASDCGWLPHPAASRTSLARPPALPPTTLARTQAVAHLLAEVRRLLSSAPPPAGALDERARVLGVAALCVGGGRLRLAAATLETWSAAHPTDLLAARLAHDVYYALGDAVCLRDGVGRLLGAWDAGMPGYAQVAGMAAFGFGECGQHDRAESLAMQALSADASDAWAAHAAVHVYDATSRLNEGDRLLRELRPSWEAPDCALTHHLHWHWALLQLEEGRAAEAAHRYDAHLAAAAPPPSASRPGTLLAACDDVSLLWRLGLAHRPLLAPPLSAGGSGGGARVPHPSDPLDARYLAVMRQGAAAAVNDDSSDAAAFAARLPAPPTRWTEAARRLRPWLGGNHGGRGFVDVHVAMALAAAGAEGPLAEHLAGMGASTAVAGAAAAGGAGAPSASSKSASVTAVAADMGLPSLPKALAAELPAHAHSRLPPMPAPHPGGGGGGGSTPAGVLGPLLVTHDLAHATAVAGVTTARGMVAWARGDAAAAAADLAAARPLWHLLGGSVVQRDVWELTLLHAAAAAGRWHLARSLLSERVGARFGSPQAWYMYGSALLGGGGGGGDPSVVERGTAARNRAYVLGLGQTGPNY
jgi:hypothetical protein